MNKLSKIIFLVSFLLIFGCFLSQETHASCADIPLSGNYTITASCSFAGTVNGIKEGNLTINSDQTLLIVAGQTIVFNPGNSVFIDGTMVITKTPVGGQLRKAYIWYFDGDENGYPDTLEQQAAREAPDHGVRRSNATFTEKWTNVDEAEARACDAGYYLPVEACVGTDQGYWSPDLDSSRYECGGNNYYCPSTTNATSTVVSSGYYSSGGTSVTRIEQLQCTAGTYCSGGVQNSASAGYYVPSAGATSQTACGGNNYYCPGTGNSSRTTVSSGYYSTGGGSTTRTGQTQCQAGYYCVSGVRDECNICTNSAAGATDCYNCSGQTCGCTADCKTCSGGVCGNCADGQGCGCTDDCKQCSGGVCSNCTGQSCGCTADCKTCSGGVCGNCADGQGCGCTDDCKQCSGGVCSNCANGQGCGCTDDCKTCSGGVCGNCADGQGCGCTSQCWQCSGGSCVTCNGTNICGCTACCYNVCIVGVCKTCEQMGMICPYCACTPP